MVDPYDVILSPWITEKSLNARRVADPEGYYKENNNRIEFIVRRRATKADIKAAIEELLEVKVRLCVVVVPPVLLIITLPLSPSVIVRSEIEKYERGTSTIPLFAEVPTSFE